MQKPHLPTLIIALVVVLALIGVYHVAVKKK
jgi:hypothetical protein